MTQLTSFVQEVAAHTPSPETHDAAVDAMQLFDDRY